MGVVAEVGAGVVNVLIGTGLRWSFDKTEDLRLVAAGVAGIVGVGAGGLWVAIFC